MSEFDLVLQMATASHVIRTIEFLKSLDSEQHSFLDLSTSTISVVDDTLILFQNGIGAMKQFLDWHRQSILHRQTRRIYWLNSNIEVSSLAEVISSVSSVVVLEESLRIIAYPRHLEKEIATKLPLNVKLRPQDSSHVLAVIKIKDNLRFGITKRELNFFESSTKQKLFDGFVSSAVCKLDEAFQRFELVDTNFESAIDLGAAPGGWTQYLAQKAKMVFAVDGADLAPEVTQLENVRHIKSTAINSLHLLNSTRLEEDVNFSVDLIVSDMNVTPLTLFGILRLFVPLLKTDGRLLATLKFIGTAMDRKDQLQNIESLLLTFQLTNIRFLWLFANTKSERILSYILMRASFSSHIKQIQRPEALRDKKTQDKSRQVALRHIKPMEPSLRVIAAVTACHLAELIPHMYQY